MFFWNQLVTPNQEQCSAFYCGLLGWTRRTVDAGPFGAYTIFSYGGADVGGMMNPTTEYSRSRQPWWQAFIAVADVDTCAVRVAELGGTVIEPPHDIPGVGRACMIADPSGAVVQLMTPASPESNAA
jgi:predicted enzyme related to lactoylglutathione lyase